MAVTRVDVVVLGLLAEEPLHGYELWERYRARAMGLWAEVGRASVYQALRRLEGAGLVSGRAQEGEEGPDKRVYRLTRPGRDRLRAGLVDRFGDAGPYVTAAATALGLAHLVSADAARRGVQQRERALKGLLATVAAERERLATARGAPATLAARMLDQQEVLARAELGWLASYRRDLGRVRR
jgi:DNA-binding PadR family transcriptional regulator